MSNITLITPVHVSLDPTLGALEIGTAVSTLLYGITTMQTYIFWCSCAKDPLWMNLFVLYIWAAETLEIICVWLYVYITTVTRFGNFVTLGNAYWSYALAAPLGALIAGPVQIFYAYRVTVIAGRRDVALLPVAASVVRIITATILCVASLRDVSLLVFEVKWRNLIIGHCVVEVVGDLSTTVLMCLYLAPRRTAFAATRKVVNKLMLWSVESGILTSLFSTLMIILLVVFPHDLYWLGILAFSQKMYSISLMLSLNARESLRQTPRDYTNDYISDVWPTDRIQRKRPVVSIERTIKVEMTPIDTTQEGLQKDTRVSGWE